MTCNITERFTRIVAGTTLFVLFAAFNTAVSAEYEGRANSRADSQSEAMIDESDENRETGEDQTTDSVTDPDEESDTTETDSTASSDSKASANSETKGDTQVAILTSGSKANGSAEINAASPDAESMVENGEAFADATYHFVEDINAAAQDAVAETVSQDIGAEVDASIKEDVRASVQEDLQTELTNSLPLPGQD